MAEREGFEPSVDFRLHVISNHAHSTTLPPLRVLEGPRGKRAFRWAKGQRRAILPARSMEKGLSTKGAERGVRTLIS